MTFFKQIPDHRIDRKKLHRVEEILLLTFCGMIAGCDSWNDLELFGKTKLDYLNATFNFFIIGPAFQTAEADSPSFC